MEKRKLGGVIIGGILSFLGAKILAVLTLFLCWIIITLLIKLTKFPALFALGYLFLPLIVFGLLTLLLVLLRKFVAGILNNFLNVFIVLLVLLHAAYFSIDIGTVNKATQGSCNTIRSWDRQTKSQRPTRHNNPNIVLDSYNAYRSKYGDAAGTFEQFGEGMYTDDSARRAVFDDFKNRGVLNDTWTYEGYTKAMKDCWERQSPNRAPRPTVRQVEQVSQPFAEPPEKTKWDYIENKKAIEDWHKSLNEGREKKPVTRPTVTNWHKYLNFHKRQYNRQRKEEKIRRRIEQSSYAFFIMREQIQLKYNTLYLKISSNPVRLTLTLWLIGLYLFYISNVILLYSKRK